MLRRLERLWSNPRIRGEAAWVLAHKAAEFVLLFAGVKLLTNLMGKEIYAEFNLTLTGALLVGQLLAMPMQQAYLRYHHTAESAGNAGAAARVVVRWFLAITVGVALLTLVLSRPLGHAVGFETWTILAGGLVFFGNRWRMFAVQLLDIRRERAAATIQNVGFLAFQLALVVSALLAFGASAAIALCAYAVAGWTFGLIGIRPFLRSAAAAPADQSSGMMQMLVRFGLPYGLLMACQWVQGNAERYILGFHLDLESVGVYIAAFQVCGLPYMLSLAILRALLVPIAYQRALDATSPKQLWAGDKVLLAGIALYLVVGAATIPLYAAFGRWLLRIMTNAEFLLPTATLVALAVARYVQQLAPLLEVVFAVHQKMGASLIFRVIGGLLFLPICWYAIAWFGIDGAAGGVALASLVYIAALCFAPGGCLALIVGARREAAADRRSSEGAGTR